MIRHATRKQLRTELAEKTATLSDPRLLAAHAVSQGEDFLIALEKEFTALMSQISEGEEETGSEVEEETGSEVEPSELSQQP